MLTQSRLKDLLHYDPLTGIFTRIKSYRSDLIGKIAGSLHCQGYIVITIDGNSYKAHRLAFLYMNAKFPDNIVDHKDTVRNNNIFTNLREATFSENLCNSNNRIDNKSGVKGIFKHSVNNSWIAQIKFGGKKFYLGSFMNIQDAEKAINDKRSELHGEFSRHGCNSDALLDSPEVFKKKVLLTDRNKNKNNSSGIRGISWHKQVGKWQANFSHRGEKYYLGCFVSKEEAESALTAKRTELSKE